VIALVAGLLVWKATSNPSGTGDPTPTASDGTDRTVGLLRERDPVCDDWAKSFDVFSESLKQWQSLNKGIPAAKWTPEQRAIFIETGEAMARSSEQFESILPKARNVVLQELIAQAVVHLRAYVEKIPTYVDEDALTSGVAINFSNAVTYMCSAVPLAPATDRAGPNWSSTVNNPSGLVDFMEGPDPVCGDFLAVSEKQNTALKGWAETDPTVPAEQWTPKEKKLNEAVSTVLNQYLPEFRRLAEGAEGRIVGDLLATQASYTQAYADAIPTYTPEDDQLWKATIALAGGIGAACEAAK